MHLIETVERGLASEESYFRHHLIREDLVRLDKLKGLSSAHAEPADFLAVATKLGWTPEDRRTHELKPALEPLLLAIHRRLRLPPGNPVAAALDEEIAGLWQAFEQLRMDRLVGCLARVPRPDDAGAG